MRWGWSAIFITLTFNAWSGSVTVQPLGEVIIYPDHRAPASVTSLNNSQLSAEIDARIIQIPVLAGQSIKSGQVLLRLECDDYNLALERSRAALTALKARLEFADYQFERVKSLIDKGSVTEELLKQRKAERLALAAEVAGQTSAVRQAELDVDRCTLRAPFNAIVTARLAQVGERAQRGTPLVQIIEANHLEVVAKVRGEDAASLENATSISFSSLGESYPLKLRLVTPVLDTRERTREARLLFESRSALPGSAGEIIWQHDIPHAPPHLLVRRNGELGLFVVNDGLASFKAISQASEGRPAEVHLPMDTLVIIEGRYALQDGEAVSY